MRTGGATTVTQARQRWQWFSPESQQWWAGKTTRFQIYFENRGQDLLTSCMLNGHEWESRMTPRFSALATEKMELPHTKMGLQMEGFQSWGKSTLQFWIWPMWCSWLGVVPQSERSLIWFQVRAHAWVAGLGSEGWSMRHNRLIFLSHNNVSLPPFLPPFLSL